MTPSSPTPVPMAPVPAPIAAPAVKTPRSKRWIIAAVVIISILVIFGVGVVLAKRGIVQVPGVKKVVNTIPTPQNLALGDLGVGTFVGTVNASASSGEKTEVSENLTVSGAFDFSDLTHPSFRGDFAPVQASNDKGVIGSFIKVGKDLYAKVSLPSISILLPAAVKDAWINLTPSAEPTDHTTRNQNLYKTITTSSVLAVDGVLSDEPVGDQEAAVYKFHVSQDAMTAAAINYRETNEARQLTETEKATLADAMQKITISDGKIWIAKDDHKMHRLAFSATMVGSGAQDFTGQYVVDLVFDYQAATITAPANAKTLQQLFGPNVATYVTNLFNTTIGQLFADGLEIAPEIQSLSGSKTDADNDNLSDTLESAYGTDPKNPDTDGDGFKDGDEVNAGYNPKGTGTLIHAAQ